MPITAVKCQPSAYSGLMWSRTYIRARWAVPNKFHSRCTLCGQPLAPGQGAVQRGDNNSWTVFC